MEAKLRMVYTCEYCRKKYVIGQAAIKHEKYCAKNPVNFKACSDCTYCKEDSIEVERDYGVSRFKSFLCSKLNVGIYPTKAERLDLPSRYPETFEDQIPMPKECEHQKRASVFTGIDF